MPKDHLPGQIDGADDFIRIYDIVDELYSKDSGRPSVDQVVLFKSVMIQHLFGILSLRRTMEEINVNVAYRCIQASISYSAIRACVQPKLFLIGFSFGQIKSFRISSEGPFIAPLSFVET